MWYEVCFTKIGLSENKKIIFENKWFPYNKGGTNRKWYGNNFYVIEWLNNGEKLKLYSKSNLRNKEFYFKEGFTWSTVSTAKFGARRFGKGYLFDNGGCCFFSKDNNLNYYLSIVNSMIFEFFLRLNPTLNYQPGNIGVVPVILNNIEYISDIVDKNISISKIDWDSFETSWDFKRHPLLNQRVNTQWIESGEDVSARIKLAFKSWSRFTEFQFNQLKQNEVELNKIFIDIYGLQDELTPEVEDKDVTIRKADRIRDIKSFISYAVGCMFGRYSLDEEGLIYAGGEFQDDKYKTFKADKDNIIPILDDTYFDEDIVSRFVEFVKVTFGEKTLDENLTYIVETLEIKNNETPRECIRRYFMTNFYKDHVKIYKKRPIYWMFDSGKQNGFKALIYLHRYDKDTVARVRTDYLHELQKAYESRINELERIVESNTTKSEVAKARKAIEKIKKQLNECTAYDQVIAHVANQSIEIDLDDGVKVNYEKFQRVEVPQGEDKKPLKANLLQKI
jgi:hypothetical protein